MAKRRIQDSLKNLPKQATCALCLRHADLQKSHIVSKSFFKTLFLNRIGKRISDGEAVVQTSLKFRLLCRECEEKLSRYEDSFITGVYRPLIDGRESEPVNDLDLLFCDSITWRTIQAIITRYAFGDRHLMIERRLRDVIRLSRRLRNGILTNTFDLSCLRYVCPNFRLPNIGLNADSLFRMSIGSDCFYNGEVLYCFTILPGGLLLVFLYGQNADFEQICRVWRDAQVTKPSARIKPIPYPVNDGILAAYLLALAKERNTVMQSDEDARRVLGEMDLEKMLRSKKFAAIVRDLIVSAPNNARAMIVARGELELADFESTIRLSGA